MLRGLPHDLVFRAQLMAQHEAGLSLSELSARYG